MRIRLLAVILAAATAAVVLLVLTLTAGAANGPQDTVKHFLQPRNLFDACNQLAPRSRMKPALCIVGELQRALPNTHHLVFSDVVIHGNHATLQADFGTVRHPVKEYYRLVKLHGVWLITSDR